MKNYNIDDYSKRIKDNVLQEGKKVINNAGNTNDNYYELAREQEYGTLFDKEVALENAKHQALKYTQNQINAQGFGGTGYGSSMQAGTYNTYLNKIGQAQNDYATNIKNINAEEQNYLENKANDRFQSVTTMLTQANNVDQMNNLLSDYGYIERDKNGNVVLDDNGNVKWVRPEGISDDDWNQIKYYYNLQADSLKGDLDADRGTFDYNSHFIYYDNNGNQQRAENTSQNWNWEVETLNSYVTSRTIPNGSYVKMENEQGQSIYLYVNNGQVYYATPEEFNENGGYRIYGRNRTAEKVSGNK